MLIKNQDIELEIESMTADGSGVGHYDGQAVFVRNTAIGDAVVAHIIKAKKTFAIGKCVRIVQPSKDRVEPDCPVASGCGGCCYRHISYDAELRIKTQKVSDAFSRIGHLDVKPEEILASETERYRNKAQYPVGAGRNAGGKEPAAKQNSAGGSPEIGFYAFNSHRIVSCENCRLQPEIFESVLEIVRKWMNRFQVPGYDEVSGAGLLRHIYIRQAHATGEMMVCLVINGEQIPGAAELVNALTAQIPGMKTVLLNVNRDNTNVILGGKFIPLLGDGTIEDVLLGKRFRISAPAFYQVNSRQCEKLYRKAAEFAGLTGNEFILDLYCGAGTIGLCMADKVRKLIGVEIIPEAIEDAKYNAEINGIRNAEFFCGDAARIGEKLKEEGITPDVIFIDPPRKGMEESLIHSVVSMQPDRIVYISCDPATLARDLAVFATLGYAVKRAVPVDLFPRTSHCETIALLSKK